MLTSLHSTVEKRQTKNQTHRCAILCGGFGLIIEAVVSEWLWMLTNQMLAVSSSQHKCRGEPSECRRTRTVAQFDEKERSGGLGFACRISQKAESLFDRQLFLDILERHLSIGSSVPSRLLLVKTEENLQPSSWCLLGEIVWSFPMFISHTANETHSL